MYSNNTPILKKSNKYIKCFFFEQQSNLKNIKYIFISCQFNSSKPSLSKKNIYIEVKLNNLGLNIF